MKMISDEPYAMMTFVEDTILMGKSHVWYVLRTLKRSKYPFEIQHYYGVVETSSTPVLWKGFFSFEGETLW